MRRWVTPLLVVLALGYVAFRLATGAVVAMVDQPYESAAGGPVEVTVERGASALEVATRLEGAGVVRSASALRWWLRYTGGAERLHAGEYRFEGPTSIRQVAEILVEGRVVLDSVTITEGSTRWQVADAIAASGFGSYDEAWQATAEVALVRDLDAEAGDLEGYLFPDTYYAPRSASARDVVEMMVERFRATWTEERRRRAARNGLTLREVVTLASLVEAETALAAERPLVSGVYHNRLERRMLLQCDPTLLYALHLQGRTDRNIRRADFDNESPYNTYRYAGLPPGPIANPGEASIDAALAPAEVDYLYFVGRNDGSHAFSRTLREHNAKVSLYQR